MGEDPQGPLHALPVAKDLPPLLAPARDVPDRSRMTQSNRRRNRETAYPKTHIFTDLTLVVPDDRLEVFGDGLAVQIRRRLER